MTKAEVAALLIMAMPILIPVTLALMLVTAAEIVRLAARVTMATFLTLLERVLTTILNLKRRMENPPKR
jgi:hypothetical protein